MNVGATRSQFPHQAIASADSGQSHEDSVRRGDRLKPVHSIVQFLHISLGNSLAGRASMGIEQLKCFAAVAEDIHLGTLLSE